MRKGISPVIAVVLLIAVAVSIGIMVTTWVTNWISLQTGSESMNCVINTNYVIDNVAHTYNGTFPYVTIKVTNKGSQALYGFSVLLDNGTRIEYFNSSNVDQGGLSSTNTLGREKSVYIRIESAGISEQGYNLSLSGIANTTSFIRVLNEACDAVSAKATSVTHA